MFEGIKEIDGGVGCFILSDCQNVFVVMMGGFVNGYTDADMEPI